MSTSETVAEIKKGSRVYSMWFGNKEYGTVTEAPRPSMMTPWHILVSVRYDNPIYSYSDPTYIEQFGEEAAHEAVREISELYTDKESEL